MKTVKMDYPYASKYNTDPTEINEEYYIETKVGICGICFGKIQQPLIDGIWYHKDSFWIEDKEHIPIPASIELQLFYYFTKPASFTNHKTKTKKCKHSRWWNDIILKDFDKLPEGFHHEHYYTSDYFSICGRVMKLKDRLHKVDKKKLHADDKWWKCERCIKKLIKLGMIKKIYDKRERYSSDQWKIKWLHKKLSTLPKVKK